MEKLCLLLPKSFLHNALILKSLTKAKIEGNLKSVIETQPGPEFFLFEEGQKPNNSQLMIFPHFNRLCSIFPLVDVAYGDIKFVISNLDIISLFLRRWVLASAFQIYYSQIWNLNSIEK